MNHNQSKQNLLPYTTNILSNHENGIITPSDNRIYGYASVSRNYK